ncbi:MAG: hypothetical protein WBK18_06120, partial [Thermacetogeniaceae bacterium]
MDGPPPIIIGTLHASKISSTEIPLSSACLTWLAIHVSQWMATDTAMAISFFSLIDSFPSCIT